MRHIVCAAVAFTAFFVTFSARSADPQAGQPVSFEVATVRPAGPLPANSSPLMRTWMITGGPGTKDPGQITYSRVPMQVLVREAYGVAFDQISGPNWIGDEKYTVVAKVPPGATKEQVAVMLQNLLVERFRLASHRVQRKVPAYALLIAESGPKLKVAEDPDAPPLRPGGPKPTVGGDGFRQLPPGTRGSAGYSVNGITRYTFRACSIPELVFHLGSLFGTSTGFGTWAPARVVDQTGLTGRYDFKLEYAGGSRVGGALTPSDLFGDQAAGAPNLFEALEKQLGLRLKKTNASFDALVIDHVEKVPTEN